MIPIDGRIVTESGSQRIISTPLLRLQPTGAFVEDGMSVILGRVTIAAGAVAALSGPDRKIATVNPGEVVIRRGGQIGAGPEVGEIDSGRLHPLESGGLGLEVPAANDRIYLQRAGNANFEEVRVRANQLHAYDSAGREVLEFNAGTATFQIGASGNEGDVNVLDGEGQQAIRLDSSSGITVRDAANRSVLSFDRVSASLTIGANENEGDLTVVDGAGRDVLRFDANLAALTIGASGNEGDVTVKDASGRNVMHFDASFAAMYLGEAGNEGDLIIQNNAGHEAIRLDASSGIVIRDGSNRRVLNFDLPNAALWIGGEGVEGDILAVDAAGRTVMHFDASLAQLLLGAQGNAGDIFVRNSAGQNLARVEGQTGRFISNGHILGANPARNAWYRWIWADDGTQTADVDLGSSRPFTAFVAMIGCDPRHNFDHGDAFALDVYQVDGVTTSSFFHGGAHFGSEGSSSNIRAPVHRGVGRNIRFRARSWQNASVIGIGVVFAE
jgi:hypothetical protein